MNEMYLKWSQENTNVFPISQQTVTNWPRSANSITPTCLALFLATVFLGHCTVSKLHQFDLRPVDAQPKACRLLFGDGHLPIHRLSSTVAFITSFRIPGIRSFPTPITALRRPTKDVGCRQVSGKAFEDHYGGVPASPDAPSYEVYNASVLCANIQRRVVASHFLVHEFESCTLGTSWGYTGLKLCPVRRSL